MRGTSKTDRPPELTSAMFHILLALIDRERHGYGIMLEVAERTAGDVRLAPGTLYRSIKLLLGLGYIIESGDRPDPSLDDERRRYYRITDIGRNAAMQEVDRLERLVALARKKTALRDPAMGES